MLMLMGRVTECIKLPSKIDDHLLLHALPTSGKSWRLVGDCLILRE